MHVPVNVRTNKQTTVNKIITLLNITRLVKTLRLIGQENMLKTRHDVFVIVFYLVSCYNSWLHVE